MRRTAKTVSLILFSALLLGGCSSIKQIRKDDLPNQQELIRKAEKLLPAEPSIVRLQIPKDAFMVREPKTVTNDRFVSISMHNVEIRDFMRALATSTSLNIVYDMPEKNPGTNGFSQGNSQSQGQTQTAQASSRSRMVSVSFNGKLSDLFKTLSDSTGYFFSYENGAIIMKERETFSVLVPNYPDLLKSVEANMVKLGAEGVGYDDISSSMSFKADYAGYQRLKEYLVNLRDNVSLVTMRIVLMNVRLNSGSSLGIDWSQLAVGYKSQNIQNLGFKQLAQSANNSSSSTSSSTSAATNTTPPTNLFAEGVGALFNTSGANLFMETSKFSLSALFSFMENFGKFNVMQNVFVETMSGKKGKIEIVTESPYVSEIGITALSNNSAATSATAKTTTAKAGVIMNITPYYNKKQQMLTIDLKVNVEGVNRYVTISAGSQLGSFMQPETTKKSVETFLRMKPEQVAIIGGMVYELNDDNVNGLPGDTYLTKNVVGKKEKEELVIIVKPTIIEFVSES